MLLTSLPFVSLAIVIFLAALLAAWWLFKTAGSTSSAQAEPQGTGTKTWPHPLWGSGLFAGLISIAGIIAAGIAITGLSFLFPTSQDPGTASGIGLAIGMSLLCFGGIWIIASSILGVWLHRRFTGTASITMGLLIGLINGGFIGISSIIFSYASGLLSLSDLLYEIVSAALTMFVLLFVSAIGGFFGGLLFQKKTDKAIL